MGSFARGLLGGIAGTADAYSDVLRDERKNKYEDQKATVLFQRSQSMAALSNKYAKERAKILQSNTATNIAARGEQSRATQTAGMEATKKMAQDREMEINKAIAIRDVEGFLDMSKEEQMGVIDKIKSQRLARASTASAPPTNDEINEATKIASTAWETMSDDDRNKYGSREAFINSQVKKLRGKSGYSYKEQDMRALDQKVGDKITKVSADISGMTSSEIEKYKEDLFKKVSKDAQGSLEFQESIKYLDQQIESRKKNKKADNKPWMVTPATISTGQELTRSTGFSTKTPARRLLVNHLDDRSAKQRKARDDFAARNN